MTTQSILNLKEGEKFNLINNEGKAAFNGAIYIMVGFRKGSKFNYFLAKNSQNNEVRIPCTSNVSLLS